MAEGFDPYAHRQNSSPDHEELRRKHHLMRTKQELGTNVLRFHPFARLNYDHFNWCKSRCTNRAIKTSSSSSAACVIKGPRGYDEVGSSGLAGFPWGSDSSSGAGVPIVQKLENLYAAAKPALSLRPPNCRELERAQTAVRNVAKKRVNSSKF